MNNHPESLTVVIPAFNSESTISRAIESAQLCGASEIIVVDDGSTDQTADLARQMSVSVVQTANQGAYSARLTGLDRANSSMVSFLDSDDALLPAGLKACIRTLTEYPRAAGVVGRYSVRAGDGAAVLADRAHTDLSREGLVRLGHAPGPPGAIVWRRSLLLEALAGGSEALNTRFAEDFELVLRGSRYQSLVGCNDVVCEYTFGSGRSFDAYFIEDRDRRRIQEHYAHQYSCTIEPWSRRKAWSAKYLRTARISRLTGRWPAAILSLICAVAIDPSHIRKWSKRGSRHVDATKREAGIFQDWKCNAGDARIQVSLALFRICSRLRSPRDRRTRMRAIPLGIVYRVIVQWILGIDLPWRTRVGPRLRIYHGYGLVVNDEAVIGADVVFRHGVTVGHRKPGGPCPVIGDRVEFGANAVVVGDATIGHDVQIAPGAVVIENVAAGERYRGIPSSWISEG